MMASRIRSASSVPHLFDVFLEVVAPKGDAAEPWPLQVYPPGYKDKDRIKKVPPFVFPCEMETTTVQNFSFVMTNQEAQWTFGFCRCAPNSETALVMLSSLPWHETFYKILNHAAELTNSSDAAELDRFLEACYTSRVPEGGSPLHVSWQPSAAETELVAAVGAPPGVKRDFTCQTPYPHVLPSIPENRNLTEYFNAAGIHNMMAVFASMLYERRILITSKRLSKVSACVQAANALIYPMHWQHIFIPILPKQCIDYLSAPMPFLIGVPAPVMQKVIPHELGDAVILDADEQVVRSPFADLESLPNEVCSNLKKSLNRPLAGDSIPRAFLQTLVHLIGGYRDALRHRQGEKISFDEEKFVQSRPPTLQPFLQKMLELQIFRQFIEERLGMLNSGRGFSDEFENESVRFQEQYNNNAGGMVVGGVKLKAQAAHIGSSMKKEGGALVKNIKQKANPAVKSAVRSVRDGGKGIQHRGKSAYRDMRSKMKNSSSNLDALSSAQGGGVPSGRLSPGESFSSSSAPSSPVPKNRAMSISSMSSNSSSGGQQQSSSNMSKISSGSNASAGAAAIKNQAIEAHVNFGRVLKYNRFDPPTTEMSPPTKLTPSPEMEGPKPLDLDLMNDLQEVIFKPSDYASQSAGGNKATGPPVNRHLKPALRRTDESPPAPYENLQGSSVATADDDDISHNDPTTDVSVEAAVVDKFELTAEKEADAEVPEEEEEDYDPFQTDHIEHMANGATVPVSSGMADLITLESSNSTSQISKEVIFDPLLEKQKASSHINQVGLPKPPSTSTLPQLAELYGGGSGAKKPLERAGGGQQDNGNGGRNPFAAMIAENNPFASQHHQQQQHQPPVGNGIPSGGHPPLSRNLPGSNFSSSTSNVTRSSDDLLQEYGIDFSKLSASPAAAAGGSSNGLNSPSPSGGALLRPTSVKPAVAPKPASLDPFADLDPLASSKRGHSQPPASTSGPPVAPPRTKRLQQQIQQQQNAWTTFE